MARHGYPEKMFIQIARPGENHPAIIGSDAIYYVPDNRWNRERVTEHILARYKRYTDSGWKILGYTRVSPHANETIHPLG